MDTMEETEMSDNNNMELNDEMMENVTGGAGTSSDIELYKVGERVAYLDDGAKIGKIREVYPNVDNLLDTRYTVVFEFSVKRNIRHTRLRRIKS